MTVRRPTGARPDATRGPSGRTALVATALAAAAALAPLGIATSGSAAVLPDPPPQGVKMGQEPDAPTHGLAHVDNDVPTHPELEWYAAGPGSSNSTGYTDFVIRTGTGRYRVWLPGLGSQGAAVVTAAAGATGGAYCVVSAIVAITDRDVPGTDVVVSCFHELDLRTGGRTATAGTDSGANPADSTFTLAYSYLGVTDLALPPGSGEPPSGYLRGTRPTDRTYVPDPAYQYNVTGRENAVDRTGTGTYLVRLPGLERLADGRAHVTGYGPGDHRCEVRSLDRSDAGLAVGLRCVGAGGTRADVPFVLTVG